MLQLCHEDNIAITPYSSLSSGRLARIKNYSSKRAIEDSYSKGKYDTTQEQDSLIIERVNELAIQKGVSMSEISLA